MLGKEGLVYDVNGKSDAIMYWRTWCSCDDLNVGLARRYDGSAK